MAISLKAPPAWLPVELEHGTFEVQAQEPSPSVALSYSHAMGSAEGIYDALPSAAAFIGATVQGVRGIDGPDYPISPDDRAAWWMDHSSPTAIYTVARVVQLGANAGKSEASDD